MTAILTATKFGSLNAYSSLEDLEVFKTLFPEGMLVTNSNLCRLWETGIDIERLGRGIWTEEVVGPDNWSYQKCARVIYEFYVDKIQSLRESFNLTTTTTRAPEQYRSGSRAAFEEYKGNLIQLFVNQANTYGC